MWRPTLSGRFRTLRPRDGRVRKWRTGCGARRCDEIGLQCRRESTAAETTHRSMARHLGHDPPRVVAARRSRQAEGIRPTARVLLGPRAAAGSLQIRAPGTRLTPGREQPASGLPSLRNGCLRVDGRGLRSACASSARGSGSSSAVRRPARRIGPLPRSPPTGTAARLLIRGFQGSPARATGELSRQVRR